MKIILHSCFYQISSVDNLLEAWKEFIKGKRNKSDVQRFSLNLMDNILTLNRDLLQNKYKHGQYESFWIFDPKPRKIHKAVVCDRLLHHAIYRVLYPFFAKTFISDSYSCQNKKGTHKAIKRFRDFAYEVSKNNTKTCWVLKCDIKKFFASIDHDVSLGTLSEYIHDRETIGLLGKIIGSFNSGKKGVGLPLGNLTSQLFVNIYMNEFDQFVKHKLRVKHYVRYADDFVVLSTDKLWLSELIPITKLFLDSELKLSLHPDKVCIKTLASGVDFLGWVHFTDHRVLRTTTKKRMFKRLEITQSKETLNSYLGLMKHGNTNKLRNEILSM